MLEQLGLLDGDSLLMPKKSAVSRPREKRERAACEEGLSEAYNAHLKMLVASQDTGSSEKSKSGRFIKTKLQR